MFFNNANSSIRFLSSFIFQNYYGYSITFETLTAEPDRPQAIRSTRGARQMNLTLVLPLNRGGMLQNCTIILTSKGEPCVVNISEGAALKSCEVRVLLKDWFCNTMSFIHLLESDWLTNSFLHALFAEKNLPLSVPRAGRRKDRTGESKVLQLKVLREDPAWGCRYLAFTSFTERRFARCQEN